MPAADDRGGSAGKGRRRRRRKAPAYTPPVRATDAKSDRERGRAESFKRTPAYRGAVRAAQDANQGGKRARTERAAENFSRTRRRRPTRAGATPEERAARARPTGRGLSVEDAVRLHAYLTRTDRNRELERNRLQRGGVNDADLRRAKQARPMVDDIRRSLARERDPEGLLEKIFRIHTGVSKGSIEPYLARGQRAAGTASISVPLGITAGGKPSRGVGIALSELLSGKTAGRTRVKTAYGARDAAAGLAHEIGKAASAAWREKDEPWKAAPAVVKFIVGETKQQLEDWEDRYGRLGTKEGDRALREEIRKRGAFPELVDLFGATTAGGAAAGRAAMVGARSALAKGAISPDSRIGRAAGDRARLRYSGTASRSAEGTKAQRRSNNLLTAVLEESRDRRRVGNYERTLRQQNLRRDPQTGKVTAIDPDNVRPGKFSGVEYGPGEVPAGRVRQAMLQRREQAGKKARVRLEMLSEQRRYIGEAREAIRTLDPKERRALKFAVTLGLTPENKEGARKLLERYIELIDRTRAESGDKPASVFGERTDSRKQIEKILDDLDGHLTPQVRAVADTLRDVEARASKRDDALNDVQAETRRWQPLARLLGVERRGDADAFADYLAERGVEGLDELLDMTPEQRLAHLAEVRKEAIKEVGAATRARQRARANAKTMAYAVGRLEKRGERIKGNPEAVRRELDEIRQTLADPDFGTPDMRRRLEQRADRLAARVVTPEQEAFAEAAATEKATAGATRTAEREQASATVLSARLEERAQQIIRATETRLRQIPLREIDKTIDELQAKRARLQGKNAAAAGSLDDIKPGRVARVDAQREQRRAENAAEIGRIDADIDALRAQRQRRADAAAAFVDETAADTSAAVRSAKDRLMDAEAQLAEIRQRVKRSREEHKQAKRNLAEARKALPRVPEGDRRRAAETEIERLEAEERFAGAKVRYDEVTSLLRSLSYKSGERGRQAAQASHLEDLARHIEHIKEAAVDFGKFDPPAYWESRRRPTVQYSLRALGGARAIKIDKAWTGYTFAHGFEDNDPQVFLDGIARNIKRHYNWNFVATSVERHAFGWSFGPTGRGLSLQDAKKEMDKRGISEDDVALFNPNRFYDDRDAALDPKGDEALIASAGEALDDFDANSMRSVNKAVTASQVDPAVLRSPQYVTQHQGQFLVVPKAAMSEVESATQPSHAITRVFEAAVKAWPSRIILGFFNVPWMIFQPMSNAGLTLLGGAWNPIHWARAQIWWRRMTPEQRTAAEAFIGVSHARADARVVHLGGAARNQVTNGLRAFQQLVGDTPLMPRVKGRQARLRHLNPMDAAFHLDEVQNNFFRRTLLYDRARKDAWDRMRRTSGDMLDLQGRLAQLFKAPPQEVFDALINDRDKVEEYAQHVNDFLGDYMTFSHMERMVLQRSVMFYGYLRFSLRFLFWTLPMRHPAMLSLLMLAGQQGAEDIRELIDAEAGEAVPGYVMGKYMHTVNGVLESIPLGKANPFLNAVTQAEGVNVAVSMLPPLVVMGFEQAFGKSAFKNREWQASRVPEQERERGVGFSLEERARIAARSYLSMAAPYRAWEKAARPPGASGAILGDDSLAWDPRPIEYGKKQYEKIEAQARHQSRGMEAFLESMHPFPSEPEISEEMLGRTSEKMKRFGVAKERRADDRPYTAPAKRKRKRKQTGWGSWGTSGSGSRSTGWGSW